MLRSAMTRLVTAHSFRSMLRIDESFTFRKALVRAICVYMGYTYFSDKLFKCLPLFASVN